MSEIYSIDGVVPVVDPSSFVHPSAVLIGDVIIGPNCYIGPCASLRGDFGRVIVKSGCNVQDTCVLHGFPGIDVVVENNGHVGHGAILHGCHIGENVLVGMNAVVMDEVEVGESSIISALAFVRANTIIPPRSLVVGVPARVLRELTEAEVEWKREGTGLYQRLAQRSRTSMKKVEPMRSVEAGRKAIADAYSHEFEPLFRRRDRKKDSNA